MPVRIAAMASSFKWTCLVAAGLALAGTAEAQHAPLPHERGASGLGLVLRRLAVTARVLYVTAHPDDEHNGVLVALSRGRGITTALLTLTRGEGGQNAVGPELNEALALLRTEELAAVHRYDGARQYFGQAFEFGFSVSLDETLARWGAEATLGDVVRVIRAFRPDVVLTMPLSAPGHQHHVAAARLAREAFRAAAEPARFPEQLGAGLRPWQASKLYQGGVGGSDPGAAPTLALTIGAYDPLLGMSWAEFGGLARTFHKSQSTRQLMPSPGEFAEARLVLIDAEPAAGSEHDLLDGVDTSVAGLLRFVPDEQAALLRPGLAAVQAEAMRARAALDASQPEATLPALRAGLERLRELREALRGLAGGGGLLEVVERLEQSEADFEQALSRAHGLAFQVNADDGNVVRGQTFRVTASVFNQSRESVEIEDVALRLPDGWTSTRVSGAPGELAAGRGLTLGFDVTVGAEARFSRPYWRRVAESDRYALEPAAHRGLPWSPPDVVALLRYASAGVAARAEQPAVWRYAGRWVGGEKQKVVNVVPELAVSVVPELAVFPLSGARPATRELRVAVSNQRRQALHATLRLAAPEGWRVEPGEVPVRLGTEGEEAAARFRLTPPAGVAAGEHEIRATALCEGREFAEGYQVIGYDHIEERHLLRPARAVARSLDVRVAPEARIGYVMGAGDAVPEAIGQLGLDVTLVDAEALTYGDLDQFSTVVLGVRAYRTRADLRAHHQRLMRYVERGGNLVVQYQSDDFNAPGGGSSPYAPYPARIGNGRVTDETAPVTVLVGSAAVLQTPNRIGEDDWRGWQQDRGTQLLDARDSRYVELISSADPFPANPGPQKGLLVETAVGKGTWTYVGLALFRQLPAGVPGAYRLLANLLSRPRGGPTP